MAMEDNRIYKEHELPKLIRNMTYIDYLFDAMLASLMDKTLNPEGFNPDVGNAKEYHAEKNKFNAILDYYDRELNIHIPQNVREYLKINFNNYVGWE